MMESALTRAAPSTGLKKRVSKFKFFGVNESGAEFAEIVGIGGETLSNFDCFIRFSQDKVLSGTNSK